MALGKPYSRLARPTNPSDLHHGHAAICGSSRRRRGNGPKALSMSTSIAHMEWNGHGMAWYVWGRLADKESKVKVKRDPSPKVHPVDEMAHELQGGC